MGLAYAKFWDRAVSFLSNSSGFAGSQSPWDTYDGCAWLHPLLSLTVPGPCGHEELVDGVVFAAKYLGSTQLLSERSPPPSMRMAQAQEAMDRVKVSQEGVPSSAGCSVPDSYERAHVLLPSPQAPEGETQPMVEVDIFISTKRVKVLAADSQVPGRPGLGCRGHLGSPRGPLAHLARVHRMP